MTYLMMISTHLRNLRQDEKGVTAMEYALIAALMAGVLIVAVPTLSGAISTAFTGIAKDITG